MIKKCCDNCVFKEFEYIGLFSPCDCCFAPKEELVREDEREKVLNEKVNLLCNDLEVTFENKEYTIQEILDIINNRDLDAWSWREDD